MADVAEHDREEEREADDREDARVDLAVSRDAVRVDEGLEALRVLGRREGGGRHLRGEGVDRREEGVDHY